MGAETTPPAVSTQAHAIASVEREAVRVVVPSGAGNVIWRRWGDGPDVVLLHGAGGSWRHWLRNIPALAPHMTLWIPDMPGCGDSDPPGAPVTYNSFCEGLQAGIDQLVPAPRPLDLVGFSFGACMGARLARRLGGRLRHLVLVGADFVGGRNARFREGIVNWRRMPVAKQDAAMRNNMQILMIRDAARIDDLAFSIYSSDLSRLRLNTRTLSDCPIVEALRELAPHVEVTGISGREDQVFASIMHRQAESLARLRPGSRMHLVDGASHWVPYEAAPQVNEILLSALMGNSGDTGGAVPPGGDVN
jgi:pimeloyl-ACP methyl ester carboxylesterase